MYREKEMYIYIYICLERGIGIDMYIIQGATSPLAARCCCDYFSPQSVFEHSVDLAAQAAPEKVMLRYTFEYVTIRCTSVAPLVGAVTGLALFCAAMVPAPQVKKLPRRGLRAIAQRLHASIWHAFAQPIWAWVQHSPLGHAERCCEWRYQGETRFGRRFRRAYLSVVWTAFGAFAAGWTPWAFASYVLAEAVTRLSLLHGGALVRWSKFPYQLEEVGEEERMYADLVQITSDADADTMLEGGGERGAALRILSACLVACVTAAYYLLQGIVDSALLWFSLFSARGVDFSSDDSLTPTMLSSFPAPLTDVQPIAAAVVQAVLWRVRVLPTLLHNVFGGVPRCEGPLTLSLGMWSGTIALVLARWWLCDHLCVLQAAKQSLRASRPVFLRLLSVGCACSLQLAMFLLLQWLVINWSHVVYLAFQDTEWSCPFEGAAWAAFLGRVFLVLVVLCTALALLLCATGLLFRTKLAADLRSSYLGVEHAEAQAERPVDFALSDLFSLVLTSFGVWLDDWNVRGYLIEETPNDDDNNNNNAFNKFANTNDNHNNNNIIIIIINNTTTTNNNNNNNNNHNDNTNNININVYNNNNNNHNDDNNDSNNTDGSNDNNNVYYCYCYYCVYYVYYVY